MAIGNASQTSRSRRDATRHPTRHPSPSRSCSAFIRAVLSGMARLLPDLLHTYSVLLILFSPLPKGTKKLLTGTAPYYSEDIQIPILLRVHPGSFVWNGPSSNDLLHTYSFLLLFCSPFPKGSKKLLKGTAPYYSDEIPTRPRGSCSASSMEKFPVSSFFVLLLEKVARFLFRVVWRTFS